LLAIASRRQPIKSLLPPEALQNLKQKFNKNLDQNLKQWIFSPSENFAILETDCVVEDTVHKLVWAGAGNAFSGLSKAPSGNNTFISSAKNTADEMSEGFESLHGSFAYIIMDIPRDRLLVGRDHLGQEQIYYLFLNELIFISTSLDLLTEISETLEADVESILWFLKFGCSAPQGFLRSCRYWSPLSLDAPKYVTPDVTAETQDLFDSCLDSLDISEERHTGILLSGGLDSTYLLSRLVKKGHKVQAYVSEFENSPSYNEGEYAQIAADAFGVELHRVEITAQQAADFLDEMLFERPQTASIWSCVTHLAIAERSKKDGFEKMWSGFGSDEIFGGYARALEKELNFKTLMEGEENFFGLHPVLHSAATDTRSVERTLFAGNAEFATDTLLYGSTHPSLSRLDYRGQMEQFYREMLYQKPEAHYSELIVAHEAAHRIPEVFLVLFNPLSRHFGNQVMYPFLHPDFVSRAAGFVFEERYHSKPGECISEKTPKDFVYKWPMFNLANGKVPTEITSRQRKSYNAPIGNWLLNGPVRDLFEETCFKSSFWETGLLSKTFVREQFEEVQKGDYSKLEIVWAAWVIAVWYERKIN